MNCPKDNSELVVTNYKDTNIEVCKHCKGMWLDQQELEKILDEADPFLDVVKTDLWQNKEDMRLEQGSVTCPRDGSPLYCAAYKDFPIIVDYCPVCRGMWLDKGEADKIIDHLKGMLDNETITQYFQGIGEELAEAASGEESFGRSMHDVGLLVRLIEYKLYAGSNFLQSLAATMPR